MPFYVGVIAFCNDLKVICDPQLALPVTEVVQRKMAEAGRGLKMSKCCILIHPDSADLVVWPSILPPPTYHRLVDPLESILPPLLDECAIQVEGLHRSSCVESTLGTFAPIGQPLGMPTPS